MTNVTLEELEARQNELAAMIEKFKAQQPSRVVIKASLIELMSGERYAGAILNEDGSILNHLILLPGQADGINWTAAMAWAVEQGGELPTRREQSLLYANLKDEFAEHLYWADEQHAANADYAWFQHFGNGIQNLIHKNIELRARAVRRVFI